MLFVIIPMLIMLILLIIYYSVDKTALESCSSFCNAYAAGQRVDKKPKPYRPPTFVGRDVVLPRDAHLKEIRFGQEGGDGSFDYVANPEDEEMERIYTAKPKMSEDVVCLEAVTASTRVPFLVSIIETLYAPPDYTNGMRYLCSAAIISRKWVLTSGECLRNKTTYENVVVRVGSMYWSKEGVLHDIQRVVYPPSHDKSGGHFSLMLVEVKVAFLPLPAVDSVTLPTRSLFQNRGDGDIYTWNGDDDLPLRVRRKHEPAQNKTLEIFKEDDCNMYRNRKSVFCGEALNPEMECSYMKGAPLVKDNFLIGVHVSEVCENARTIHYFLDVSYYYKWLRVTSYLRKNSFRKYA